MHRATEEIRRDLDEVTAGVFQAMMALPCTPAEGDESVTTGAWEPVCAQVDFLGALQGCCVVMLRPGGAVALVRAMLNLEIMLGDDLGLDAVRELCNMIAGGWKSGLDVDACGAGMTPPTECRLASIAGSATVARRYAFEGNLLEVELRLPGFVF